MSAIKNQLENLIQKLIDSGEYTKTNIEQLRANPKLVNDEAALQHFIQGLQITIGEMDEYQKGINIVTKILNAEITKAEKKITECKSKVIDAQMEINDFENSRTAEETRLRKENEEILDKVKNLDKNLMGKLREISNKKPEITEITQHITTAVDFLSIIGLAGTIYGAVFSEKIMAFIELFKLIYEKKMPSLDESLGRRFREMDAEMKSEIVNRMAKLIEEDEAFQNRVKSIKSKQNIIVQLNSEIEKSNAKIPFYLAVIEGITLCKYDIIRFLLFFKTLENCLQHLSTENTVNHRHYVQFINSPLANEIVKAATNMLQITSNLKKMMNKTEF